MKSDKYPSDSIRKDEYGFKSDTPYIAYYPSGLKKEWKTNLFIYRYNNNKDTSKYVRSLFQSVNEDRMEYFQNEWPQLLSYSETREHFENCQLVKRISPRYTYFSGIESKEVLIIVQIGILRMEVCIMVKRFILRIIPFYIMKGQIEGIINGRKK